jgi:hypothetical protein
MTGAVEAAAAADDDGVRRDLIRIATTRSAAIAIMTIGVETALTTGVEGAVDAVVADPHLGLESEACVDVRRIIEVTVDN